jgi:hypothetical protein
MREVEAKDAGLKQRGLRLQEKIDHHDKALAACCCDSTAAKDEIEALRGLVKDRGEEVPRPSGAAAERGPGRCPSFGQRDTERGIVGGTHTQFGQVRCARAGYEKHERELFARLQEPAAPVRCIAVGLCQAGCCRLTFEAPLAKELKSKGSAGAWELRPYEAKEKLSPPKA